MLAYCRFDPSGQFELHEQFSMNLKGPRRVRLLTGMDLHKRNGPQNLP